MTQLKRMQISARGLAVCLSAAALLVAMSGFRAPRTTVNASHVADVSNPPRPLALSPVDQELPPLEDFEVVWRRDLRRPLYDPPPPPPPQRKETPPKPRPTLALVGIMSEPGRSRAMLALHGGRTEMKAVGDVVDDRSGPVEVLEITPDAVLVNYLGERYRLTLPEPEGLP